MKPNIMYTNKKYYLFIMWSNLSSCWGNNLEFPDISAFKTSIIALYSAQFCLEYITDVYIEINALWTQNCHQTSHNHIFTYAYGVHLWLVGIVLNCSVGGLKTSLDFYSSVIFFIYFLKLFSCLVPKVLKK